LQWLKAINGVAQSEETKIILKFAPELDDKETAHDQAEIRKNELSEHIARLEAFENLSRDIKSILKDELGKFEKEY
jgi:hypothetical protein